MSSPIVVTTKVELPPTCRPAIYANPNEPMFAVVIDNLFTAAEVSVVVPI
jgi:hypothetical protein